MPDITTATGEFATREGAEDAVARLVEAGFHRSDIDVSHRGHLYVVEVHIGPDSRSGAQRAVQNSSLLDGKGTQIAVLGAVALAGAALLRWAKTGTNGAHRPA